MNFDTEKIKVEESFSENGITFLMLFTEHIKILSDGKGAEKINSFYSELSHSVYEYAKNKLLCDIKSEYENSDDPRKRFSFRPYSYRLSCDASEENEECISVMCKLFFTRKGKILYEKHFAHIWCKRTGKLVSTRGFSEKKHKKHKKK